MTVEAVPCQRIAPFREEAAAPFNAKPLGLPFAFGPQAPALPLR